MGRYSKEFRIQVAKEAAQPESRGLEHIIAEKYEIRPWTVVKWRDIYLQQGEIGLSKGNLSGHNKSKRELELEKENAERGLIAAPDSLEITTEDGKVAWSQDEVQIHVREPG